MTHFLGKIITLLFFLSIIILPALQEQNVFIQEQPLKGYFLKKADCFFSFTDWLNGNYSKNKEDYITDNFGFRNSLIRFNNQLNFWLFKESSANDVVIGKDNYLFEKKYIDAIEGLDFVGDAEIEAKVKLLKKIQDELQKQNKQLLIVLAPSKAQFVPEKLPDGVILSSETNYNSYCKNLKKFNINYIDFNSIFLTLRNSNFKYPLYPQTGTHWSVYSMHLAMDSICRRIESLTKNKLLKFSYNNIKWQDTLLTPDDDIEESLNLLIPPKHYKMAYPKYTFDLPQPNIYKPNVLTISDSYWMGIFFTYLPNEIFDKHQFWYYNEQIFGYSDPYDNTKTNLYVLNNEIRKYDLVLLMASDAQLNKFGWGAVEQLSTLTNNDSINELQAIKSNIYNTQDWLNSVKIKAKSKNIALDSMVTLDALYMMNQKK